ncbi:hypothetical protein Tco_1386268 [Tanacetum coccineum]
MHWSLVCSSKTYYPSPLRSFGKLLEDIHVTWTQSGKKRDKIAALHEVASKNCIQCLETASQFLAMPSEPTKNGVKKFVTASELEYGVSTSIGYGVFNSLSNTAYSSHQINTAYLLLLDTARHFKTLSLDELRSPDFNLLSDQEYSEEEEAEAMAETMEQYMSKTRTDYGSGVARPKIDNKDQFELKGQFLKELRENTFSGSDNEDANEHIEKVLEIVDLFHVPNITVDQLMLRVFLISLTEAASRWLKPTGSIKTWEDLKTKFLNKYCPPGRTAKKMEEINNFQQEPDETLYQA